MTGKIALSVKFRQREDLLARQAQPDVPKLAAHTILCGRPVMEKDIAICRCNNDAGDP
jgi:hypothetical protein